MIQKSHEFHPVILMSVFGLFICAVIGALYFLLQFMGMLDGAGEEPSFVLLVTSFVTLLGIILISLYLRAARR